MTDQHNKPPSEKKIIEAFRADPRATLYTGIDNEAYHAGPGISKSQLDFVRQSPALLEWVKNAPVDTEAEKAVDTGNLFEALLLEPERFHREYCLAPDEPKNTKAGKAAHEEAEAEAERLGQKLVDQESWRKVHLMRDSVMAHPVARRIVESAPMAQTSYYWVDETTGLLCRCRPDILFEAPFCVDVKTTASIERFPASVDNYRYHVQDAFYSDGLGHYFNGERPSFAFLTVSTTRSAGRFPVHVYELTPEDRTAGREAYLSDLARYKRCIEDNQWADVEVLERPYWARRRDLDSVFTGW